MSSGHNYFGHDINSNQHNLHSENNQRFFLPALKTLDAPVSVQCQHCGSVFSIQRAMRFCWPDRPTGEQEGWVVNCDKCGSRIQVLDSKPTPVQPDPTPDPQPKTDILKIIAMLLTGVAVLVLVAGIGLNFYLRNQTGNNQDNNNGVYIEDSPTDDDVNQSELFADNTDEEGETQTGTDFEDTESQFVAEEGEDNPTADALIQAEELYGQGNSPINISQGGLMVIAGDYVYYTNPQDSYYIYRMDLNFENQQKICDIPCFYLNYYDGKLYFAKNCDDRALYRMNLDGSSLERLNNQATYEPKIVGNYIYYEDIDDNYSLWRCDLDGNNAVFLADGVVSYCCVSDSNIFYIDTQNSKNCYMMDLNGGDKSLLFSDKCRDMTLTDGILYVAMSNGGVYSYNTYTHATSKISDLNVRCINVIDDWIYFGNVDDNNNVYKMTTSGGELTKVANGPALFINVYGNLISFENSDSSRFYWCLTDSSNLQYIS